MFLQGEMGEEWAHGQSTVRQAEQDSLMPLYGSESF